MIQAFKKAVIIFSNKPVYERSNWEFRLGPYTSKKYKSAQVSTDGKPADSRTFWISQQQNQKILEKVNEGKGY